jgi:uncharacterized damage-inducible protein DinB
MATALELQQRLDAVQARLNALLTGVTEEQFKRRPAATADDPKPWSIAEVLAHELTIEETWIERIEQALREDGGTITPSPPELHEEGARRGRMVAVPQLIHALLGARRRTEKLLDKATAADGSLLANTLWHPRLEQTLGLEWMFEKIAGHYEAHCPQIEALRELVGAKVLASLEPAP